MKNLRLTTKVTLWFSISLIIVVLITYVVILSISDEIIKKTIRDNLIEVVENNYDEIEYLTSLDISNDVDYFIEYNSGYIEVDDDFLDEVNDVYTGLYEVSDELIYGENPIISSTADLEFSDGNIQSLKVNGILYYVYDRELSYEGIEGLYLRGVVSEVQGQVQMSSISKISLIILPSIVVITIIGGYLITRRVLNPLNKINKEMEEIGSSGNLKRRLKLDKGHDEVHNLGENFNNMLEKLEISFNKEKQFTTDASHELRTPMSVIMSECELLLEKEQTKGEYIDGLKVIERQGKKMTNLINDMLIFTRMEQNKVKLSNINLSEIVSSVCSDMKLIKDKNIILKEEIEPNIKMNGNEELLVRMLTNLISNAYRYGRENGYILVSLKQDKDNIILTVKDNGIGIKKEHQKNIFNRFYQVDDAHSSGGSGLGLALVLEIVEKHDGNIKVNSKLDEYTIFTVTFPKK